MSELKLTVDDLQALGEKLDNAGLTEAESVFLAAAVELAAQTASDGDEVQGFNFGQGFMMTAIQSPNLRTGFGSVFRTFGGQAAPGPAASLGSRSIIIVGG